MSLQRTDVSFVLARFRNIGDRFLIHYFMINSFFLNLNSALHTQLLYKIHLMSMERRLKRFVTYEVQTLTFLERPHMIRLCRKITILLILKLSLPLKMPYVPILNSMIKMTIPHYNLICCR